MIGKEKIKIGGGFGHGERKCLRKPVDMQTWLLQLLR
jgi:hypothetical protein